MGSPASIIGTSPRLFEQTGELRRLHFIHLLVSSSWHMVADFNMSVAKADAQPILNVRGRPSQCWTLGTMSTAPPVGTDGRATRGSRGASGQQKPSWSSSEKHARPLLCCLCIIYFLVPEAGLYFCINSILSSQLQPHQKCFCLPPVLTCPTNLCFPWPNFVLFIYISP